MPSSSPKAPAHNLRLPYLPSRVGPAESLAQTHQPNSLTELKLAQVEYKVTTVTNDTPEDAGLEGEVFLKLTVGPWQYQFCTASARRRLVLTFPDAALPHSMPS